MTAGDVSPLAPAFSFFSSLTVCGAPAVTAGGVLRVYLVVVDIRIVDCHMYPGEPCPPSHVLSYIPPEASMQYIHNIIRISILSYKDTSHPEHLEFWLLHLVLLVDKM